MYCIKNKHSKFYPIRSPTDSVKATLSVDNGRDLMSQHPSGGARSGQVPELADATHPLHQQQRTGAGTGCCHSVTPPFSSGQVLADTGCCHSATIPAAADRCWYRLPLCHSTMAATGRCWYWLLPLGHSTMQQQRLVHLNAVIPHAAAAFNPHDYPKIVDDTIRR